MTREEWKQIALETGDDVLFAALEDWEDEVETLEQKNADLYEEIMTLEGMIMGLEELIL